MATIRRLLMSRRGAPGRVTQTRGNYSHPAISLKTRTSSKHATRSYWSTAVNKHQVTYLEDIEDINIRRLTTDNHCFDVDTDELVAMIETGITLIDVRQPEELIQTGQIPRAINIPLNEVEEALTMTEDEFSTSYHVDKPKLDDRSLVFTCAIGIRSRVAMELSHQLGYTQARHYKRGWIGWHEYTEHKQS